MRILLGLALATLLVAAGMAQDPKIDGPWYGTISPPGAQFDVGVTFQRRAGGWTGMLLLETCVSPHEGIAQNPVPEAAESPTQAVSGTGCRPTRAWLRQELGRHFQHVYFTRTQPWHEQFPSDWSNPPPGLTRAVAVASRESLESAKLTTEIPMLQERH